MRRFGFMGLVVCVGCTPAEEELGRNDAAYCGREELDAGRDSTIDSLSTGSWNSDNERLTSEDDIDADGTVDSVSTFVYDGERVQVVSVGQGRTETVTNDVTGLTEFLTFDFEQDGTPERFINTEAENGAGDPIEQRFVDVPEEQEIRYYYEFDSERRFLLVEWDVSDNATIDYRETWEWFDRLTRIEIDLTGDGETNSVREDEYDERGNLLTTRLDVNDDGEFDTSTRNDYDTEGNVVRTEIEAGDQLTIVDYDFDGDGRVTTITTQLPGDTVNLTTFTYEDCPEEEDES